MRPIELASNQIRRFYRGGSRIASFRGLQDATDDAPEDWVASTTTVRGGDSLGLTRLGDGTLLRDAIREDPEAYLGPAHVAAFGSDPALLVKLLDAGERLPLHLHPDDAFARAHLGEPWGKTEAWVILEADAGASVHVGFARDVGAGELDRWFVAQDLGAMVGAMNRLPARPGDTFFVPAGLPHVIGEGTLLLELQQPSDLSLLLERGGATEAEACLGLARELALRAVDRCGWADGELERLTGGRGRSLFPADADDFFRAERVAGGSMLDQAFSILVVLDGEGGVRAEGLEPLVVRKGSTVLVPYAVGPVEVAGSLDAIRCRPPASRPA